MILRVGKQVYDIIKVFSFHTDAFYFSRSSLRKLLITTKLPARILSKCNNWSSFSSVNTPYLPHLWKYSSFSSISVLSHSCQETLRCSCYFVRFMTFCHHKSPLASTISLSLNKVLKINHRMSPLSTPLVISISHDNFYSAYNSCTNHHLNRKFLMGYHSKCCKEVKID